MGTFRIRVTVCDLREEEGSREIEMVLESSATSPVIPRDLAEHLGTRPGARRTWTLADGRGFERNLTQAGLVYDGRTTACMVVLGEPGDLPLLGAHAFKGFGFEVDPVAETLRPATQYLVRSHAAMSKGHLVGLGSLGEDGSGFRIDPA